MKQINNRYMGEIIFESKTALTIKEAELVLDKLIQDKSALDKLGLIDLRLIYLRPDKTVYEQTKKDKRKGD